MKTRWFTTLLCSLAATLILAGCSQEQTAGDDTNNTSTTAQKAIHPALNKLDLDGEFILFADTSEVEQSVLNMIDRVFDSMVQLGQPQPAEMAEALEIVSKVKSAITWSGLIALDSYAMSTKTLDNDLTRSISFIGFSGDDDKTALWRILAADATPLKGIGFAPADAVYTCNYTASLSELWKALNEAILYVPEEGQQQIAQQIAMVEMMIGISMDELVGSLDNEILLSLQLSETRESTIPIDGEMLTIPEPSLLVGLQTKDSTLSDLILEKLQAAQAPMTTNNYSDQSLISLNLPLPMPFPVQPTLVQTDGFLLIGSNREVITKALDAQSNSDGLVTTEQYKMMMADAPEKTSAIEYMSPRVMETVMAGVKQVSASQGEEFYPLFEQILIGNLADASSGTFTVKDAEGIYCQTLANFNSIELLGRSYLTGIASAVSFPVRMSANLEQAITVEAQVDIATLSSAIQLYEMYNGSYPATLDELLDPSKEGYPFLQQNVIPTGPWGNNYQYLAPGVHNTDSFDLSCTSPEGEVINNWN